MEEKEDVIEVKFPDLQNEGVSLKFVKCSEDAILPTRNHDDIIKDQILYAGTADTGFDIYGSEDTTIPAHGSAVVPTGIKVGYITPGFWFKIESRSGLSFKADTIAHPGVIDNQYRGDTGVKLYNFGDQDLHVEKGDRIAQLAVYPIINPTVEWIDEAEDSARGEKGFGSSGS